MKDLVVKAGERTKILHIVSDSIPQDVTFTVSPVGGNGRPSGTAEIVRSPGFLRKRTERHPVQPAQTFRKGFADVDYALYLTPGEDVRVAFQSRHLERRTLFWILGAVAALAVLAAVAVPLALSGH
jgi:hypothetical protein